MIEVNDVVAGYIAEVDILRGVSLNVDEGEIVTILGPNGCGKSTLLKTIAGYLFPRQGKVTVNNKDVGRIEVHNKIKKYAIGYVPQLDNVFGSLSVWENLELGGHFMPRAQREQRREKLYDIYPILRKKSSHAAASLSGGERQVLSLARALMPEPKFLLLDEPSAGLAPKTLTEVFDAIVELKDREQVGILMVEQNAMEALYISDRAYVLSMGKVALQGGADELLASDEMRRLYLGGKSPD